MLGKDYPDILKRSEQILDFYEKSIDNRSKRNCPNLGILITQYLMSQKKRDIYHLIDEMFARNCLWSLNDKYACSGIVVYDDSTQNFKIVDINITILPVRAFIRGLVGSVGRVPSAIDGCHCHHDPNNFRP